MNNKLVSGVAGPVESSGEFEFRYRRLFETAQDGILILDGKSAVILDANPSFLRLFGYTLGDLLGSRLWELGCLVDWSASQKIHQALQEHESVQVDDLLLARKDGQQIHCAFVSNVYSVGSQLVTQCIFWDITRRVQAEKKLEKQDQLLQLTGAMAKVGGWEYDARTKQGAWTDEVARMHGLDPAQPVDIPLCMSLYTPGSREKFKEAMRAALENSQPYDLELELVSAQGEKKWVRTVCQPVVEQDKVVKVHGTVQDITVQKRSERLLVALNQAARSLDKAFTPAAIYQALMAEFQGLGISCVVFLVDEGRRRLYPHHHNYHSSSIHAVEKLVGFAIEDFSFPIEQNEIFRQTIREQKPCYVNDDRVTVQLARDMLPAPLQGLAQQMVKMLRLPSFINVPLLVNERVIGILSVQSNDLTEADIPTITAFAGQVSANLRKAQLYEQAQQELVVRAQVESALRESELRYRTITENMSDTVWLMDASLQTTWISPSVVRTRGYTLEELQSLSMEQNFSSDSFLRVQQMMSRELTPEKLADKSCEISASGEFEFTRKDGSLFWADMIVTMLRDADGNPSGFLGVGRDITERKRAESAQREAEVKFRLLVEQIPAVTYLDKADAVSSSLFVSPQIQALTGCTPQEWMADPHLWFKLLHPEDRQRLKAEYLHSNETGEPFESEYRLVTKDGRTVWVRDEALLIRDEAGQPLYWLGVIIDSTEQKQAEQQIKTSLAEKEVLLKEVHHRVKNNLAIVSSLLEMQARRSQNEQVRNELLVSQQRVQAMAQIHEQLYRSQNLAQIDMADYVGVLTKGMLSLDILSDVSMKADIRDVRLEIDQAVSCGLIINELLTNALKYAFSGTSTNGEPADQGQKEILVAMQPEGDCYVLKVSDNGIGIPDGVDVRSTRTLGLRLVNRLAGQLGGDIRMDSRVGGGATLTISFPIRTLNTQN
jgi:PAS domain S-box-containing protein